jgi:hypothetical protein
MSNIIAGNGGGGRGGAAATAAITAIALILILMASPVILTTTTTTTTKAFAASFKSNTNCTPLQFRGAVESQNAGKTVTLATSQKEYSLKLDYILVTNDDVDTYYKNVGADDPRGRILLPAGKTITITLRTQEGVGPGVVTLYNQKVSDCQILLDRYASTRIQDKDKIVLKVISREQGSNPDITKVTVQVPDASEVGNKFTKLGVYVKYNPEVFDYYLISNRVQVVS